jgi:hypothetical protein
MRVWLSMGSSELGEGVGHRLKATIEVGDGHHPVLVHVELGGDEEEGM